MFKERSVPKVSAHLKENEWVFISRIPHFEVVIQDKTLANFYFKIIHDT
jgi:hypothetical protein